MSTGLDVPAKPEDENEQQDSVAPEIGAVVGDVTDGVLRILGGLFDAT